MIALEKVRFESARKGLTLALPGLEPSHDQRYASLVTVASASGGVGCSTVAMLFAWLAAQSDIRTALLEADLQFGDYGSWLSLDDTEPTLGDGPFAASIPLAESLQLYKAPLFPEQADEVDEDIASLVPKIRNGYDLMVADAGSHWSGLTAELARKSDLVLLVFDSRRSSAISACKAAELCARLGVPSTKVQPVYNRWSSKATLSAKEAMRLFGLKDVPCIPDGKQAVDALMSVGEAAELIASSNPAVRGVNGLLKEVLPKIGCVGSPDEGHSKRGLRR